MLDIAKLQTIESSAPIDALISSLSEKCEYNNVYAMECWQDIKTIVTNWNAQCVWELIREWSGNLPEVNCSVKFAIASFTLRVQLIESLLDNTSMQLLESLKKSDVDKLKPYLASEVQYLLSKLNDETDMNDIEKLRDRFSFVSSIISQLDS